MVTAGNLVAILINGLAFGIFLALLGVGITLVFGLGEVLNLAIGTLSVVAVISTVAIMNSGPGLAVAAVISVVLLAVLSLVIDRSVLSLVYRSEGEERTLLAIFVTLGLAVFIDGIIKNFYPGRYSLPMSVPNPTILDTVIIGSSLVNIVVGAVILAVIFLFLRYTYLGKATRTIFQDETGAMLVGVNPRRIRTLIFVLSAVVAGVAGLMLAIGSSISVSSAFQLTVFGLIVSIVGGVRSLGGAVGAGIFLGLVNQAANAFIGSYIATIIMFVAAIVVLLAEPEVIT